MELHDEPETEVPSSIQCPECEHEVPVDPDWQEGDVFACPNCSIELQVTSLEPVWIDFAPETEESWDEGEEMEALDLEDEEVEDEEEGEGYGGDEWSGPATRRAPVIRLGRLRLPARREAGEVIEQAPTYLTPEGADRLRQELDHLRSVRLPKVAQWLSEALSEGFEDEDVTELEEARSEMSFVENRIRSIEALLATAEFLEEPQTSETVQLGSRVTIQEMDTDEPETYRIVSPAEADPSHGFISYASPLGKALMDRRDGEQVTVKTPDGPVEFRILKIN